MDGYTRAAMDGYMALLGSLALYTTLMGPNYLYIHPPPPLLT